MQRIHLAITAALGVALCASATCRAQSADVAVNQGKVYGYVDLKTGTFHQIVAEEAAPETITGTTVTGTLDVTISIKIVSTLPKGTTILCDADVSATSSASSPAFLENYTEVAASPATISGSTASCVVKMPYSWVVAPTTSKPSNTYQGTYKVTATSVPSATQPITDFNVVRQATGIFANTTVIPSTGTTSSFTVSATI